MRKLVALSLVSLLSACGGGATAGPGGVPETRQPPTAGAPAPIASTTVAPTATPAVTPTASPGASASASATPASSGGTAASTTPIKHVVVIIQENRSFDNIFHGFTEPSGAKADYADFGLDKTGAKIALTSVPFEQVSSEDNGHSGFVADYDDGKMDGFYDHNALGTGVPGSANGNNGLSYIPQTEVQPYWDLATQGALAERFFHGVSAASYPSHLMFAAASTTYDGDPSHRVIDNPSSTNWGCGDAMGTTAATLKPDGTAGPAVPPCFTGVSTLADSLDATNHTWHWYSPVVNGPVNGMPGAVTTVFGETDAFQSYHQLYYGPHWSADAVQPETRVLGDVTAGTLEDVTFVTPDAENSDHRAVGTSTGPAWVASVVNTIGLSPYWNSTAVFVTWDDSGGFYDHVVPPQKYGVYGLGMRIGLIAISPYAKHGQLIDTQLEAGSVMKFIEETFNLPSLGRQDSTATSASVLFDFAQKPAAYKNVAARYGRSFFLAQKPSHHVVDTDSYGPSH